ncbi:MAG: 2-amino-4-hydroxy-6-hydroxymethyldihydropteridine diphosphokinase [Neolewinella sp.]|jgi:2-amino-4-hydroxy-6-hydroxymethyldihydropteridine diphosphokinase
MLTLALGANLGDRHATLAEARRLISERVGPIVQESSLLETKAWGMEDQPDFLNQVIIVDEPGQRFDSIRDQLHALLDITQGIELALGRERKSHWGPRTCDIDLIFLDDIRYEDERISLPHPWWAQRDFVGGIIKREFGQIVL